FGCAANSHDRVHAGSDDSGGDAGGKIAVADELDACARFANVSDELFVPRTIEHHDHEIFDVAVESFGDILQIFGDWRIEGDRVFARRADDDLLHVAVRSVEQASAFGGSEHGDGAGSAGRAEICALERVDGDIDLRNLVAAGEFGADMLADVE